MSRAWSYVELVMGVVGGSLAIVLMANARWCFFAKSGCGMWEPLFAIIAMILAVFFIAAGAFRLRRRPGWAALCYVPIAILVVALVGQAAHWW